MKQIINNSVKLELGIEYSLSNPTSFIISNRLVQLQQYAGGMGLLASIQRAKSSRLNTKLVIDTHVSNLVITYGLNAVVQTYELIYGINNRKQKVSNL